MGRKDLDLIDNWLRHIRDVRNIHSDELDLISDPDERANRLVELKLYLIWSWLMIVFMHKLIL